MFDLTGAAIMGYKDKEKRSKQRRKNYKLMKRRAQLYTINPVGTSTSTSTEPPVQLPRNVFLPSAAANVPPIGAPLREDDDLSSDVDDNEEDTDTVTVQDTQQIVIPEEIVVDHLSDEEPPEEPDHPHLDTADEQESSESEDDNPIEGLEAQLFDFMAENQITHSAMHQLLRILNGFAGKTFPKLPRNPRTLMARYASKKKFQEDTDTFVYIGIRDSLQMLYKQNNAIKNKFDDTDTIELMFNVDGLPLYGSNTNQVWPILMSTNIAPEFVSVVGVWFGNSKPLAEELLSSFIKDLKEIFSAGILVTAEKSIIIPTVKYLTCDIPAIALIKGGKGATAYGSCTKCSVYGEYHEQRVCFLPEGHMTKYHAHRNLLPHERNYTEAGIEIIPDHTPLSPVVQRTDASFRNRDQPIHHDSYSLFEDIEDFDMVESFTIDGMHTIYICGLKRFLHFLRGHESTRVHKVISEPDFFELGTEYGKTKFPREFSRPSRSFAHIGQWKATELRSFVLYGGDIILNRHLPKPVVHAFRCFSMAVRILTDEYLYLQYNAFAKSLITCFLDTCVASFGKHFMTLATHYLSHLPAECVKFGPIDSFSCFKYENVLKSLKKRCRSFKKPLKSLSNQLRIKSTFISKKSRAFMDGKLVTTLKRQTERSSIIPGVCFNTVVYRHHILTVNPPDCYFVTREVAYYRIREIVFHDKEQGIMLVCNKYDKTEAAYYVPTADETRFESLKLGIARLVKLSEQEVVVPLRRFGRKCVVHCIYDQYYAYPMI